MKMVYTAHNLMQVGHMRNVLESEGIRCVIRNDGLVGGAGELPLNETWPELWVEREMDWTRAEQLVEETLAYVPTGTSWICRGCGEELEPQFTECWNCGGNRPKDKDKDKDKDRD